jgi:hypothetical protein
MYEFDLTKNNQCHSSSGMCLKLMCLIGKPMLSEISTSQNLRNSVTLFMIKASITINPNEAKPTSLLALAKSLFRNRQLIVQMTKREVVGRFKDSLMGLAWSIFNPVLILLVYTFVFSMIFKARWGVSGEDSQTLFDCCIVCRHDCI